MRRTLTRALKAAGKAVVGTGAVLALAIPATAMAASTAPPPNGPNEPWCATSGVCLQSEGNGVDVNMVSIPGGGATFYTDWGTSTWDGITVYIYVGSDGYCPGWNGVTGGNSAVKESRCTGGADQQFWQPSGGWWANVGASEGTGHTHVVMASGLALLNGTQGSGGPPNSEHWDR